MREAWIDELLSTSTSPFPATELAHRVLETMDIDAREDLLASILTSADDDTWDESGEDEDEGEQDQFDEYDGEFANADRFYDHAESLDVDEREDLMRRVLEQVGHDEVSDLLSLA